jgi:hypothetical protein
MVEVFVSTGRKRARIVTQNFGNRKSNNTGTPGPSESMAEDLTIPSNNVPIQPIPDSASMNEGSGGDTDPNPLEEPPSKNVCILYPFTK